MHRRHLRPDCLTCGAYIDDDEACRACLAWDTARQAEEHRAKAQRDLLVSHFAGKRRLIPVIPAIEQAGAIAALSALPAIVRLLTAG